MAAGLAISPRVRWLGCAAEILVFTGLTVASVNRFAPAELHADVLLNSVMSLQHVTLFYWGQDRLANVLPLVASPVTNASWNLYLCLSLTAAAFYGMIWAWAAFLARGLAEPAERRGVRLLLALAMLASFFFVLRPTSISQTLVWHIEYTLPYLLLEAAVFICFSPALPFSRSMILVTSLLLVATGVNYSVVIAALAIVAGSVVLRRRIDLRTLGFGTASSLALVTWAALTRTYSGKHDSYFTFPLGNLNQAAVMIENNFTGAIYASNAVILVLLLAGMRVAIPFFRPKSGKSGLPEGTIISALLLIFAAGYFLIFASSPWVAANGFSWRYFAPLLWVGLILLTLQLAPVVAMLRPRVRLALTTITVAGLTGWLASPWLPLSRYPVFNSLPPELPTGVVGYTGNYWLVWPAVMRSLMIGKSALGFADRGQGNAQNCNSYFAAYRANHRVFTVACLGETVNQGLAQVADALGDIGLVEAKAAGPGVLLLDLQFRSDGARVMRAPLQDDCFALRITVRNPVTEWRPGTSHRCAVEVRNDSRVSLSSLGGDRRNPDLYCVHLSYRWVRNTGVPATTLGFDNRFPLPGTLEPHASLPIQLDITAPIQPGRYRLEIEAVQEGVAWFYAKGSPGFHQNVEVKP